MKWHSALAFMILFPVFANAQENIAVLDFKAINASAAEASAISEFIRTALVNKGVFNVLERSNIDKILAEQGFQQTGCTRNECAVRIGKILNVQEAIVGSYTEIGNLHVITANVVDIETSRIIISKRVQFENIVTVTSAIDKLVSLIMKEKNKLSEIKKRQEHLKWLRKSGKKFKKEAIAVLDFRTETDSAEDSAAAIAISDFMRTALVKTEKFKVAERRTINKVLAKHGFRKKVCATKECAIQIGKLLNVQKAVIGSYGKYRDMHSITADIVDIKTGKIIRSEKVTLAKLTDVDSAIDKFVSFVMLDPEEEKKKEEFRKKKEREMAKKLENLREKQDAERKKEQEKLAKKGLLAVEKGKQKELYRKRKEEERQKSRAARAEHVGNPGVGFHSVGGSLRYFAGIFTLEGKYVYGNGFRAIGPRLYLNFNPNSKAVVYIGGEYSMIRGESELQKFTGAATGAFVGMELFISEKFSFLIDIGPYTVSLDSEFEGINVVNGYTVGNIGVNLYF
ncbi:MAG: CsgG/HfaB family protein [bacterium]